MAKTRSTRRSGRKTKRILSAGQVHIFATFNNTIITISDMQGNAVVWSSGGKMGFKGSRKATPFASRLAVEDAMKKALDMGLKEVEVIVKGPGPGRDSSIRAVQGMGVKITSISDVTPIPHNGCRPPKRRRI